MCVDVVTTGFTGAENANIKFGDTVVVMGIGPIGLMAGAFRSGTDSGGGKPSGLCGMCL